MPSLNLIKQVQLDILKQSLGASIKAEEFITSNKKNLYKKILNQSDVDLLVKYQNNLKHNDIFNCPDINNPFYIPEHLKDYFPVNLLKMADFGFTYAMDKHPPKGDMLLKQIKEKLGCGINQAKAIGYFIKLSPRKNSSFSKKDLNVLEQPTEYLPCQFPRLRETVEKLCNIRTIENSISEEESFKLIADMLENFTNRDVKAQVTNWISFYEISKSKIETTFAEEGFSDTYIQDIIKYLKKTNNC